MHWCIKTISLSSTNLDYLVIAGVLKLSRNKQIFTVSDISELVITIDYCITKFGLSYIAFSTQRNVRHSVIVDILIVWICCYFCRIQMVNNVLLIMNAKMEVILL